MRKPLPTGLDIELRGGLSEETTPHAGAELLIDLGRRSGVMAAAEKYLPQKKSPKRADRPHFQSAIPLTRGPDYAAFRVPFVLEHCPKSA